MQVNISKEKIKKLDVEPIIKSVVDDFNNIYKLKRGINILYENDGKNKYYINGIENRIEQIIANLLDNAISFSADNKNISVKVTKLNDHRVMISILDEGQGFKEKDTNKIFKRFYSNRPDKFGEHSGLGLNIVKNLVDLHDGEIGNCADSSRIEFGGKSDGGRQYVLGTRAWEIWLDRPRVDPTGVEASSRNGGSQGITGDFAE